MPLSAEIGQAASLELYKLASTIFLGIGIAAVLQGRLVPRKPDFPITKRAQGLWATADIVAAFAVLVCIAVGQIITLKVISTNEGDAGEQAAVIVLLVTTTAYVVVSAAIQRALAYVWEGEDGQGEPTLQRRLVINFCLALTGGLLLGAGIAFVVLGRDDMLLAVAALGGLLGGLGTRGLGQEVAGRGVVPPGYEPSPVPLDEVVGVWTAARTHKGLSLMGGKVIVTDKYVVFTPLSLNPTLSWLQAEQPTDPDPLVKLTSATSLSEPVAIPLDDLERVEVLNRAKLLRPPTARLHFTGGRHLDVGILASPSTANFRSVNNEMLAGFLSNLRAKRTG